MPLAYLYHARRLPRAFYYFYFVMQYQESKFIVARRPLIFQWVSICHYRNHTYLTIRSFLLLSCRSSSVCRISCTILRIAASSTLDILMSGSKNAEGKALVISTVLYLVATLRRVFINMVCRVTSRNLYRRGLN